MHPFRLTHRLLESLTGLLDLERRSRDTADPRTRAGAVASPETPSSVEDLSLGGSATPFSGSELDNPSEAFSGKNEYSGSRSKLSPFMRKVTAASLGTHRNCTSAKSPSAPLSS